MLEYLKWRGDLSWSASPLNELDALVFSQLSYLHFCDALGEQGAPLRAAWRLVEALPPEPGNAQAVADRHKLLRAAGESARFGGLTINHCVDVFDAEREMQFAAVTYDLPDGTRVIGYRGTDATVIGWREDFNMSFACPVPSQTEAVRYLERVAARTVGRLRLCGHSKGGNLALYAAACCTPKLRARIGEIYLFDAPGFDQATLQAEGYREVLPRVRSYVPQTSVIGRLMGVPEPYTVVHSTATGLGQHNVFSWALDGPHFETLPALDNASRLLKATMDDFLNDSTPEMRKLLVETVFAVLGAGNAHTLGELAERWTDTATAMWTALRGLDPATRRATLAVLGTLAASGMDSAKRFLSENKEDASAAEPAPTLPPAQG